MNCLFGLFFLLFSDCYRFKPSSEWRRHPDLTVSAKPGLSSLPATGTPPRGPPRGAQKLRPPSKKTHYRKAFKNVTPPPPGFKQGFLRGGGAREPPKISVPLRPAHIKRITKKNHKDN